jgi:transposase
MRHAKAAAALAVTPKQLAELECWLRSPSIPAGLAQRARIIALAAQGVSNAEIAALAGCARQTVVSWRQRFDRSGLDGLADRPKPGRPRTIDLHRRLEIVAATLAGPPPGLGVTHWSSRLLARQVGVSNVTVARVWREYDLQPWRTETFKFSTDPYLDAKVGDVVGLYLHPPEQAVVVCIDEQVPDPGAGPHGAGPAATPRAGRAANPRLRPARHNHTVRRAGDRDRQGDRPVL